MTPVLARSGFTAGILLFTISQVAGLGRAIVREGELPGLVQDPFYESRTAMERGDRARASRELRAGAAIHRYNLDMLLRITETQARAGDREGSRRTLEQAARLAPGTPELQAGLGWILVADQRWGEAENAFRTALSARPRDAWVLAGLGELLFERDHFAEAADAFSQSLAIQPEQTAVRASLGIAYALSGRPEKAVEEFTIVLRVNRSPQMLQNLRRAEAAVREAQAQKATRP